MGQKMPTQITQFSYKGAPQTRNALYFPIIREFSRNQKSDIFQHFYFKIGKQVWFYVVLSWAEEK
jgi:hypothetical protein